LRFSDRGKFRRWRKAFERGGKNRMGAGGAAGRLIELRQRQRSLEFERARGLLASDAQSFVVRGLGGVGVASCENVAAHAVKIRILTTAEAVGRPSQGWNNPLHKSTVVWVTMNALCASGKLDAG
jgi:hypothetical protein